MGAKDRPTAKSRPKVVDTADKETLQAFVADSVANRATLYTDGASAYNWVGDLFNGIQRESVNHSVGEYVRDMTRSNGEESFWSMLKCGKLGTITE